MFGVPLLGGTPNALSWRSRAAETRVLSHRGYRAANRIAVNRAFPGDGEFLILNLRGEGETQLIAAERSAEREGSERRGDLSADRRVFLFEVECQLNRPLRRFRSDRPTARRRHCGGWGICGASGAGASASSPAESPSRSGGPGLRRRFDFVRLAVDKDMFDLRATVEEVAAGDDDVGDLALLDAAQLFGHAEDLRRVDGHRLDRLFLRQSGFDGLRGVGEDRKSTRLNSSHLGISY